MKQCQIVLSKGGTTDIFDELSDMVFVINSDDRLRTVNRTLCDRLRYEKDQLTGNPSGVLFEESFSVQELRRRIGKDGKQEASFRFVTVDGDSVPVQLHVSAVQGGDEATAVLFCVAREEAPENPNTGELESVEMSNREEGSDSVDRRAKPGTGSGFRFSGNQEWDLVELHRMTMNTAFYLANEKFEFIDVNEKACQELGYEREELLDMTVADISTRFSSTEPIQKEFEDLQPGSTRTVESVHRCRDGTTFPVEIQIGTCELQGKRVFLGLARNISDRKKREKQLQETRSRLEKIIDAAPVAITAISEEDEIEVWNPAAEEMFGWAREEVIGERISIIPDERQEEHKWLLQETMEGKGVRSFETKRKTKDGEEIDVLLSTERIQDGEGNPEMALGIFQNISNLKEAQHSLEESERRFRHLAETIDEIFWIVEPDWSNFEYVNPAYEEIIGRSRDVLLNEDPTDFLNGFHPDDRDLTRRNMRRLSNGENVDIEVRVNPTEDFERWVHIQGRVVTDETGEVQRIIGTSRDITDIKKSEELEQALQEREVLLKEIHHRVKNNLQIITSMLSMQALQMDDDTARNRWEECLGKVQSMALVHRLLYQSDNFEDLDMKIYIERLIERVRETVQPGTTRVTVNTDIQEDTVNIDTAVACGLILTELLSNCYEHAFPESDNGTVSVTYTRQGERRTLSVKDDGSGISNEAINSSRDTIGFELIQSLVDFNLQGELDIGEREQGTNVRIRF